MRSAAMACVFVACAGPAPVAATTTRLPLRIEFEPPLAEVGELRVEHECGERLVLRSGRAGVDLVLPPGPVALTLRSGDRDWHAALRVEPGMAPFVWRWRDAR